MNKEARPAIQIRWPNEEKGGWYTVPGLLVAEGIALAVFDDQLEVHLVKQTSDVNEYDLQYASNPMFHVGDDLTTILNDLETLTMAEFAAKYTHCDFMNLAQQHRQDQGGPEMDDAGERC